MGTPTEVKVTGFAVFNRIVRTGGNSGRVNLPPELVGRRVLVILTSDPDVPLPPASE